MKCRVNIWKQTGLVWLALTPATVAAQTTPPPPPPIGVEVPSGAPAPRSLVPPPESRTTTTLPATPIGPGVAATLIPAPGVLRADAIDTRRPARQIRDYSWIHIDPPVPQEIKVHDIVTIIVDEKAEVVMNSRFARQRNGNLKAELKEFIRFDEDGNLANAALNQPTIDATMQSRFDTTGQATDQEGIRYRIAATVVDVLPNGMCVLEARKSIRSNRDVFEYRLTGKIDSEKISKARTALSEDIAELDIQRHQHGKVYGSTKRGWGMVLWDVLSPF